MGSLALTDFRFQLQAEADSGFLRIALYPKGLVLLQDLLPEQKIHSLAFESHYTLHSFAEKLKALGDKIRVRVEATTDLVEKLRVIKDEEEIAKIRLPLR